MALLRFNSLIEIYNGNPYVLVSASRARMLKKGWKRPMPVRVQINGKPEEPWQINMMPRGDGGFYLYLHGYVRKVSATKVGDRVRVSLSFDSEYRAGPQHPMPSWFRVPLSRNNVALDAWNALIPSRKKEILRYFSWLKSPEARARNLAQALDVLSGKHGRFMARTWKNGK